MKVTIKALFTYCHSIRKKLNCWLHSVPFSPMEEYLQKANYISTPGGNWLTDEGASNNRLLSFYGSGARGSQDT